MQIVRNYKKKKKMEKNLRRFLDPWDDDLYTARQADVANCLTGTDARERVLPTSRQFINDIGNDDYSAVAFAAPRCICPAVTISTCYYCPLQQCQLLMTGRSYNRQQWLKLDFKCALKKDYNTTIAIRFTQL